MKAIAKPILLTALLFMVNSLFATVCVHSTSIHSTSAKISLTHLSAQDYQAMVGKKMTVRDKIVFHFAKKELMAQSTTVSRADLDKMVGGTSSSFNLGGFLLGLIFSILGVLVSYLFGGDIVKWAWKGFWVSALIWLVGLLIGNN
jgi:hypothetical protein